MRPMDLAKKLRREAAFDPAALERGKVALMAAMRQDIEPRREPTIVPELPYQDIGAALTFLERAFGFREVPAWRLVTADGVLHRAIVAFGDGVIAIGEHGAHGALSPKSVGVESQYISVDVADVDAHYQRALAAGARIAKAPATWWPDPQRWVVPPGHVGGERSYEAFDPEGHRWRFHQRVASPA